MQLIGHVLNFPLQVLRGIIRPVHNVNPGVNEFGHRVANTGNQIESSFGTLFNMLPLVIAGGAAS